MGWESIIGGAAASLGGGLLGDALIGDPNSADAYDRQKNFYKHRYQWMMKDMRKAGLNPILAAGSAGFSTSGTPTVAQSHMPTQDLASSAQDYAGISKVEEEAKTEKSKQGKLAQESLTEIQKRAQSRGEINKIEQEITNLKRQWYILDQTHNLITQQAYVTEKQSRLASIALNAAKANVHKIEKLGSVYEGHVGTILKYIETIANAIGLSTSMSGSASQSKSNVNTQSLIRVIK